MIATASLAQPTKVGRIFGFIGAALWWPIKRAAWLLAATVAGILGALASVALGISIACVVLAFALFSAITPLGVFRQPARDIQEILRAMKAKAEAEAAQFGEAKP